MLMRRPLVHDFVTVRKRTVPQTTTAMIDIPLQILYSYDVKTDRCSSSTGIHQQPAYTQQDGFKLRWR